MSEPGSLVYLEDDARLAPRVIATLFAPQMPEIEIAWVDRIELVRNAIRKWARIAAFVLDYRIGDTSCEGVLVALRQLYPPPTPVYLFTGFSNDPFVGRLAARHGALLLEKGSAPELRAVTEEVRRSRARVLALRRRLRGLVCKGEALTPREVQLGELVAAGVPTHALCDALELSRSQCGQVVRELLRKTGFPVLAELVRALEV